MTPKEKAKELLDKFQKQIFFDVTDNRLDIEEAKGCALIAVDEIINSDWFIPTKEDLNAWKNYLEQVKHEIEQL